MRTSLRLACCLLPFTLLSFRSHAQGGTCADAVLVTPGGYTADGPFDGGGASQNDAANGDWYAFDPDAAGFITVSSCGGTVDTRVHIHTGSCGALTLLGTDDDGCPLGYPPGNSLLANIPVTPGNLYYIEWDDRWSGQGFDWTLYFHTCPVPLPPTFTATDSTLLVDWTAVSPGSTYHIEYGPAGFTQGTGTELTGVEGTDGPPVELTGLSEGTFYDVYVWLDCGLESSPIIGPWPGVTTGSQVANDDCADALPIACGDALSGSTLLAFPDAVPDCGTTITAPGIWYTFSGIGGAVTLSTCGAADFDTKINVYAGGCGALNCQGGNDDAEFCDVTSEYTFIADINETYHILIQGYNGDVGDFTLSMTCVSCPAPQTVFTTPSDTEADVHWSSFNPNSAYTIEYGPTGFTPGTGTLVTGINGIDGPPAHLTGLDPSTGYDVYISEDCGGGDVSPQAGPYTFTTLTDPPPGNTFCADALPISCGDNISATTTNAVLSVGPTCGPANISAPGVWYTFTGNGQDIALSTCDQAAYDTKISVFTGPCTSLSCVMGNDDGPNCGGNTSDLIFHSVNGETYLVLVHGYDANTGNFTLSMDCSAPCTPGVANDDCAAATVIAPQAIGNCVALQATTICAFGTPAENPPCDPYANIADVWFSFNTGNNADHTLTVTAGSAALVNVGIYQACDELNYVDCFNDVTAPIDLVGLDLNTVYYVRVWNGGFADAGTFTICDEADIPNTIAETTGAQMHVYPVPARGTLNVDGLPVDIQALFITDLQGRNIARMDVHATAMTIDISTLAKGSYLLHGEGGTTSLVRRFVVE